MPEDRATRLDGDSRPVVIAVTTTVALLGAVAFALGVPGLMRAAEWAGLPPQLRWGVPAMLDGSMIAFALAGVVRRGRRESTRFAMSCLGVLVALSTTIQVVQRLYGHVAMVRDVVGASVDALAPIAVFATTHLLLDLAINPAVRRAKRQPSVKAAAAATAHKAEPKPAASASPAPEPAAAPALRSATPPSNPAKRGELADELLRAGRPVREVATATGLGQRALYDRKRRLREAGALSA